MKRNQLFIFGIAAINVSVIGTTVFAMDSAFIKDKNTVRAGNHEQVVGGEGLVRMSGIYGDAARRWQQQSINGGAVPSTDTKKEREQTLTGREGKQDRFSKNADVGSKKMNSVANVSAPGKPAVLNGTPIKSGSSSGVSSGNGLPMADRVVNNDFAFIGLSPEMIEEQRKAFERFASAKKGTVKQNPTEVPTKGGDGAVAKGEHVNPHVVGRTFVQPSGVDEDREGFVANSNTHEQKPSGFDPKLVAAQELVWNSIKKEQAAAKNGSAGGANGTGVRGPDGSSIENGNGARASINVDGSGSRNDNGLPHGSNQGAADSTSSGMRDKIFNAWSYKEAVEYLDNHKLMAFVCAMGIVAVPTLIYYALASADDTEKSEKDENSSKKKTGWLKGILKRGKKALGLKKKVSFA